MFDLRSNFYENGDFDRPAHASHAFRLKQAINQFNQARWCAALAKIKSIILRRSQALLDLEIIPANLVRSQRYGGMKPVCIDQICGSLGRSTDFNKQFHPLSDRIQDRWVNIAMVRSQNLPLAPVELIQVGDCYFVQDGHHRISVACARGESVIDAEIVIWELSGELPWETQPLPASCRNLFERTPC
jgi:hypothetical protein